MNPFRCSNCNKLLGMIEGKAEIKCPKCKTMNRSKPVTCQEAMQIMHERGPELFKEWNDTMNEEFPPDHPFSKLFK